MLSSLKCWARLEMKRWTSSSSNTTFRSSRMRHVLIHATLRTCKLLLLPRNHLDIKPLCYSRDENSDQPAGTTGAGGCSSCLPD